ncbi:MAG: hypothetical protein JSV09_00775, partial [Thermoplasmata archaeon]
QVEVPFPCIWNYTDSNGESLFKLATQEMPNGNKNFTFKIISKVGSTESGKIELEHGQDYTFDFYLEGSAPNPELTTSEQPNPNPPDPKYRLGVSYQVKAATQNPRNLLTGNYHPEEIPPEKLPEPYSGNYNGNHVDSFVTDGQGFFDYMKGYYFDSYEYAQNSNSDAFDLELTDDDDWYFVISNRDSIETIKIVELTIELYHKAPTNSVRINNPINDSKLNIGGIVTISGILFDENDLLSLKLSMDGGSTWKFLGTIDNHWDYNWDTSSLDVGIYTIDVIAEFTSGQDSDAVEIHLSDLERPKIEILNPTEYYINNIGSTITIEGTATDNKDINSLLISIDDGNSWIDIFSSLQNGNWRYDWETTGYELDLYTIQVKASDGSNQKLISSWDRIEISDMQPPTVTITEPIEGEKINIGALVTINGTAGDNLEVTALQISTDSGKTWRDILLNLNETGWYYNWDTTGLPLGYYTIIVNVSDDRYYSNYSVDIELEDTEGPLVLITKPEKDSKINIGSQVTIFGDAKDNLMLQTLKLSTDGGKIWVDILSSVTDGKWSYEWDTQGCSPGMCMIKIKASDGEHQVSDYVQVELMDSTPPNVTITSPSQDENIECGEMVTITGTASDNIGITELKLTTDFGSSWFNILPSLNNGNWHYDWDTKGLIGGKYTISISASDGVNPQVTASVKIDLIDMEKPELEITTPIWEFQYDVGDLILMEGKATDNVKISDLEISLDNGVSWIDILPNMDSRGRWSYLWDTSNFDSGTYDVRIRASDGTNEIEDSLTIILIDKETKDEDGIISFPMIWWLITIGIVLFLAVIVSAFVFKKHQKKKQVVVVEEMKY